MPRSLAVRQSSTLDTVREVLGELALRDRTGEVLTAIRHIPAREAQYRPMPDWVRPELASAYKSKKVEQLYTHQVRNR